MGMDFDVAADDIESFSEAIGANGAIGELQLWVTFGFAHPVVVAAVAVAGGAPALGGVPGEVFWVEFGEGFAGDGIGAFCREPA